MSNKVSIFWFRRDLRLNDNAGLSQALASGHPVIPIFIFDEGILSQLENKNDRRVDYIHQVLTSMNSVLKTYHSRIQVFHGKPLAIFHELDEKYSIQSVFTNRDYEPKAIARDTEIYSFFKAKNTPFFAVKDQVIFDKKDILKSDGTPYTVYTPYSRKWKEKLDKACLKEHPIDFKNFYQQTFMEILPFEELGFRKTEIVFKSPVLDLATISVYDKYRDYPAVQGTTLLGIALRFGTIGIRECVKYAQEYNETWLNELIWREFFMQILYHFPRVVHHAFKANYDNIEWRIDIGDFEIWCEGKTGYPIVDAGMRQLNETGYMHNRVRMIVASFLCKHLLIDWRWGEAYFAQKLDDYDLSANNGNWQWAAGTGCDAAPYFRVFNPTIQTEKFDKNLSYIKKWVPEWGTDNYPKPMIDHSYARERALNTYGKALNKDK